jgi:hypothetical protein
LSGWAIGFKNAGICINMDFLIWIWQSPSAAPFHCSDKRLCLVNSNPSVKLWQCPGLSYGQGCGSVMDISFESL